MPMSATVRRFIMKRAAVWVLIAAFALFAPSAAPARGEGEVRLSFVRIGNDAPEKEYWEWVIADFEAANPGIYVQYDDAAIGEPIETKLNTLFASGAGPDIIGHGILSVAARVELGHYQAIDAYFEAWEGRDDIMPSVLQNGVYGGRVYGLAYSVTPYVFAYRTDYFEQAGLDPASPPKTWEELAEFARELTVVENGEIARSGFCFPMTGGNLVEFDVFVFGNGGRFMDADGNPTLDGGEKLEALEFLSELLPDVNLPYSNNETNPFVKGLAAMTLMNNVALTSMLNDPEYEGLVNIALPPDNGHPASFCGCNMLFIGRDCKNNDEAFAFIGHALSKDALLERTRQTKIPVTRLSLVEQFQAIDPMNAARSLCVEYGVGMPRATWATQFQRVRNELVQSALFGGADIGEALSKAQSDLLFEIDG